MKIKKMLKKRKEKDEIATLLHLLGLILLKQYWILKQIQ